MIAVIGCILIGLLNLFFPKKVWYLGQLMLRIKNGKAVFTTEDPTTLVIVIHRLCGSFLIGTGLLLFLN